MAPRIKTLEARAHAAGRAFACDESDFEVRVVSRPRLARLIAVFVAVGGALAVLIQTSGLTGAFSAWRSQS